MIGSRRLGHRNFEKDADRLDTELGAATGYGTLQNKVHLVPGGTGAITIYPKTATGLAAAITASASGDKILIPNGTISGNHTNKAGVQIIGWGENSILSGTITNNGIVTNIRITGSISNGTSTAFYRVFDGSSVEHFVYGTAVDLRWQFGNAGVTPSFSALSLDALGKAVALIAGTQGAGLMVQDDGPITFGEDSRATFLADGVGAGYINMALFNTTGNLRIQRILPSPALYGDPGYKLYIDGTLYIASYTDIKEIAAPSAPSADTARVYSRDDGGTTKLYYKRSDGTEVEIGAGGVGAHNILSASHTDSNSADTPVEGDALVYRTSQWEAEAPVDIASDAALITGVNFVEQISDPSTPGSGHWVIYTKSDGLYIIDDAGTVTGPFGTGGGTDADAIHDNVSGEIAAVTEKASPVNADLLLIEDSAASNAKKRVQIGNLPSGSGDSSFTAAYASRPAAGSDGDLFLPSDGFHIERDTGAAWVPWGPLFPFTAPVDGDFAWINQGGASVSTTNGGIYLLAPAGAGNNFRIRKKAAPATPYTITAVILPNTLGVNYHSCGLLFRQSSDGKLHTFGLHFDTGGVGLWRIESFKWTNPTTFSAVYTGVVFTGDLLFLRIADNGTSRICSISRDGQNFIAVHTVGRTDFLTADEVGFYANTNNASYDAGLTLLSWKQA